MTKVSSTEVQGMVGPQLGVTGGVATGLGIHYEPVGDTDVSSSTPGVEVKLNEKSFENAMKKTGVFEAPKAGAKGASPSLATSKIQNKADDRYVGMFSKRGLSSQVGLSHRPDYRAALSAPRVGPVARVQARHLRNVREMFKQVAAQKTKRVPISVQSLSEDAIKRIAEDAHRRGDQMTPIGTIDQAMKRAGMKSPSLRKSYDRWAHALFPGSYESMPTPTKTS